MKVVVVLLCGIPGAGKSTFSSMLRDQLLEQGEIDACQVLSFDEFGKQISWNDNSFHTIRENSLQFLKNSLSSSSGESDIISKGVIIIDDTMHLRSMRREVYQIARDQSTPLLVIWVKSSKECSWARNERRIGDTKSFVEEQSFAAVVNSFQAPDTAHICDRYNITVDSDDGSNVLDEINLAIGFISSAFDSYDTFVSKFSSDSSEKRQSEKLTALQQMEELLRNIVSGIIKSVISSPLETLTTKQVSSLVAEVKVAASRNVKLLSRELVFEQINGIVFEQFQHQVETICRMHGYDESISSSINRIVMSIGTLPNSR